MRNLARLSALSLCATLFVSGAIARAHGRPLPKGNGASRVPAGDQGAGRPPFPREGPARESIERRGKAASVVSSRRFAFERKGSHMARVVIDGEATIKKGGVEKSQIVASVYCYNRDYSFQLIKQDAKASYSVKSLETGAGAGPKR